MRQFGHFLTALGGTFAGLAQDQQRRRDSSFQDLQADNLRGQMAERTQGMADVATQRKVLADNWPRAQAGDPDAQAKIVSVFPSAANLFQQTPKAPTPPRTLATSKGIMQWNDEEQGWRPTGFEPPERAQDSRPVVVQGAEGGPVVVDPRSATSRPVVTTGGDRLNLKAPTNISTAYNTNKKQIGVIRNAIRSVQARPQSTGFFKGRIDALDQRLDPEGVDARANIADIGSMTIHDRSGAAVTIAEYPRLAPFIPTASDAPDAVVRKLNRMAKIIEEDNLVMAESFPALQQTQTQQPSVTPSGPAAWLERRRRGQ